MSRVVMLLSNAFRPDPRVAREAAALVGAGLEVTIVCWDRCRELPRCDGFAGAEVLRIHDAPSSYARGWRQTGPLTAFWRRATRLTRERSPDVVHCHDLDTLFIGWRVRRQTGCRLVYDAHEPYPALMSLTLPRPMVRLLELWERWLQRHADLTITASTVLRDEMLARGVENVTALGNFQEVTRFAQVHDGQVKTARSRAGVPPGELLVAYIGGFTRNRALLPLLEAAALLPDVHFRLWGDGPQRAQIEEALTGVGNVRYLGWLAEEELPVHYRAADIVYYGLRHDYPGAVYTASNSVAAAMAAGRPVIASDLGDVGRLVRDHACGVPLSDTTREEIAAAITRLRDRSLRKRLGEAGHLAAETSCNAAAVQALLVRLYTALLMTDSDKAGTR